MGLNCKRITFSGHAFERMLERSIDPIEIKNAIRDGEIVESYPDDLPFPSLLLLGMTNGKAVHVVVAHQIETETCIVVTVYRPDSGKWNTDFRTRRPA